MKHFANQIFLPVLFVFGVSASSAQQITLTAADMPHTGIVITNQITDTAWAAKLDIGMPGANRTWNFASPVAAVGKAPAVTTFLLPGATPYGKDFPQAGLASRETQTGTAEFTFFQSNADCFSLTGTAEKAFQIRLNNPIAVFKFPVNYPNVVSSKVNLTFTGNIEGDGTIIDTSTVDAWGTVATPLGNFQCLRVKRVTKDVFTIGNDLLNNKHIVYEWWTNQYKSPVFTYRIDTFIEPAGAFWEISAEYLISQTSGVRNLEFDVRLSAFPNPATDLLMLEVRTEKTQNAGLSLYDAQGRMVKTVSDLTLTAGDNKHPVDIADLAPGIYWVVIARPEKVLGVKQVVVAAR
jgi:Secretion system C-terminal sorting domain